MDPVPAGCFPLADQVAALEAEERSLRAALANLPGLAAWGRAGQARPGHGAKLVEPQRLGGWHKSGDSSENVPFHEDAARNMSGGQLLLEHVLDLGGQQACSALEHLGRGLFVDKTTQFSPEVSQVSASAWR
jgi:hypothetical protein